MDFGLLAEESFEDEAEPPAARANLPYAESAATELAKPAPVPAEEPAPTEATPSSSAAPPPEV